LGPPGLAAEGDLVETGGEHWAISAEPHTSVAAMEGRPVHIAMVPGQLPRYTEWWSPLSNNFWTHPEQWPVEPQGQTFLVRAFGQLGKAMFRDHWTGLECAAKVDWNSDPGPIARRATILDELAKRLQTGELISFLRPFAGGLSIQSPSGLWNTERERIYRRFMWCQVNPDDPFGKSLFSTKNCWIYLTNESLGKLTRSYSSAMASYLQADEYLSPYMRIMIAVKKNLKVEPDNQLKKTTVEEELVRVAQRFAKELGEDGLSKNLIGAMATLIRDPESKKGRAKKPK
jgi:hypothetical protein